MNIQNASFVQWRQGFTPFQYHKIQRATPKPRGNGSLSFNHTAANET